MAFLRAWARRAAAAAVVVPVLSAVAVDPFADRVVSYTPGLGVSPGYDSPATSVGSPERMTGEVFQFVGAVTPFNPAFGTDEIVSIGGGGSLIVAFDEPIVDDPANPFGLDLIVFGNAGFIDSSFPLGVVSPTGSMFGVGSSPRVSVSADGSSWFTLSGQPDGLYPTLGYSDLADAYSTVPGSLTTDFTQPVNPALNAAGMSFAALVAAYDGSGGGTGFDLSSTGLGQISFVRFDNLADGPVTFEIDAVSDVSPIPAPGGVLMYGLCGVVLAWRRSR